jgi:hypothetical protein
MKINLIALFIYLASINIYCQSGYLDGKKINIPNISGYIECHKDSKTKSLVDNFVLGDTKLFGLYLTEAVYNNFEYYKEKGFSDYCQIYTSKSIENRKVTPENVDGMIAKMKGSYLNSTWGEITKRIKEKSDLTFDIPVILEVKQTSPNLKCVIYINNVADSKGKNPKLVISFLNFYLINNRLVNIAYYFDYKDENSISIAKSKNNKIVQSFVNENK